MIHQDSHSGSLFFNRSLILMLFLTTQRILQLVHGLLVDGPHAVVHKGAAQQYRQGEDPGVVLVVTLEVRTHLGRDYVSFLCLFPVQP